MKICFIADIHLFSEEIGGNWSEDSFTIFKDKILPKLKEEGPEAIIFLGDLLDPHSGKTDPRWPKGDEVSRRFVKALKKTQLKNIFALLGNHDYLEPLKNISEMGGPKLIEDDWYVFEDISGNIAIYFFSSRYPNIKKASDDLMAIPDIDAKTKILLMHENLGIRGAENIPKDVMEEVSKRFDIVLNGHQHVYQKPYPNVWCLSSTLPWRPGHESSDIEIFWNVLDEGDDPEIRKTGGKFGFYILDTDKRNLNFLPIDMNIKIIIAKLFFSNSPATLVRDRLIQLSKLLSDNFEPENSVIRVYLEGTLKEGDERIDVGFSGIEKNYYSDFYDGRSRNVLRVEKLKGGGAYLNKEDLKYVSVDDALKQLESEVPKIRDFYKEVYDLIEKKTFDSGVLIERIKKSSVLGGREVTQDDL